jgi:GTPase
LSDKIAKLAEQLADHKRVALAKAITLVENQAAGCNELLSLVHNQLGTALVVGFTGPPGVGKSTLVNAYITQLRSQGQSVGVIAVDPSSPLSGGAILGDRIRMTSHANDDQVFVRSLASRGHLGGLSRTATHVIDLMDAFGMDIIILETVGTGQSEVEVADIADVKVVVMAPGFGDDIQAVKAGILEIADILVVNKADNPLAEKTARQLESRTTLSTGRSTVPVLKTIASSDTGVHELAAKISEIGAPGSAYQNPEARSTKILKRVAKEKLQQYLDEPENPVLLKMVEDLTEGRLDFDSAADQILNSLAKRTSSN